MDGRTTTKLSSSETSFVRSEKQVEHHRRRKSKTQRMFGLNYGSKYLTFLKANTENR